jgi:chromatin remodeling complex protein RSC6
MKPVGVSEEMRVFLQMKPEELTRRLDITKRLCEYIKVNDLQHPGDRRNIVPDKRLRELFKMTESEPNLTYYSIQQKLKDHIIKV